MPDNNKMDIPERDRYSNSEYKGITPLDREIVSDVQTGSAINYSEPVNNNNPRTATNTDTETAAEIAAPVNLRREVIRGRETDGRLDDGRAVEGRGLGILALALSIISLFFLPVILGAAGIIVGFIARRRGATATGSWAIGIGIVSIILGIFIMPFF